MITQYRNENRTPNHLNLLTAMAEVIRYFVANEDLPPILGARLLRQGVVLRATNLEDWGLGRNFEDPAYFYCKVLVTLQGGQEFYVWMDLE